MKKLITILLILFISLAFVTPIQASATTSAGVKPGEFFYFFDTAFEKISLFFTIGSENKARKALKYADERLAEAEESANENNSKAVERAMVGYREKISFVTEKSKELKDQNKVEELLNIVSENIAKHQEVLVSVLEKVPEEVKQAILNAIEISKKGQEEVVKYITELKSEIEELKKEVVEVKAQNKIQIKTIDNTTEATKSDNTTFCNGVYYTQCPADTKFICPKTGEAYCETQSKKQSVSVLADTLICNGKEWLKCPVGQNFYCPAQGDAQCVLQPSVSTNNQTDTSVSGNLDTSQLGLATQQVEKLLQQEISKQNSWYEEYLQKQAEIDEKLKPIHEEEDRITEQYMTQCIQFVTGQKASECDQLTLRLNSLEAEASRISGIYPERKTLPKVPSPEYESWRIDKGLDGLSGTIWSPNSTTRYRWSCINPYSCTLYNY